MRSPPPRPRPSPKPSPPRKKRPPPSPTSPPRAANPRQPTHDRRAAEANGQTPADGAPAPLSPHQAGDMDPPGGANLHPADVHRLHGPVGDPIPPRLAAPATAGLQHPRPGRGAGGAQPALDRLS